MAKKIVKGKTTYGVSRYTFFELLEDDIETGKATYGDPVELLGTVEIAPTDSGGTNPFDADNGPYEVDSYIEKMGHDITNADIPPEVDAMWRGATLVDNGVEFKRDTAAMAPYFAAAWMIDKSNGAKRLVRYYKGKYGFASNVGAKTKPSEGAPEHQTAKATFSASFRECDDKGYYFIDTDNLPEGITEAEAIKQWFTDPNWYPTGTTVTPTVPEGE